MPTRNPGEQPDFSSLLVSLTNSKIRNENHSLYQTIYFLIKNTAQARDVIEKSVDTINETVSEILAGTFLTVNDETNDFPNSRQLLAGLGITFDDTIAGKRTINSSGSGGGIGNYYDAPLTDGHVDETNLIFARGECIIVQVPNVP